MKERKRYEKDNITQSEREREIKKKVREKHS
jgi:hypothetical protein